MWALLELHGINYDESCSGGLIQAAAASTKHQWCLYSPLHESQDQKRKLLDKHLLLLYT